MQRHTISFKNAGIGIWTAVSTQPNIRIHLLAGSLVLFLASYFHLNFEQILDLLLTIALVITTEFINTAIEFACDAITLDKNPNIKKAKDVAAGAVLFVSIFAVVVGFIIFVPALINYY